MNRALRFVLLGTVIGLSGFSPVASANGPEVVAYYAGWKWYQRNKLVRPETIRYTSYTTIIYAFFRPDPDGTVREGDSFADPTILLGKEIARGNNPKRDSSQSLVCLAHRNGVRVLASVGGWTWSDAFAAIAADPERRDRFAAGCRSLVRKYNLDGIDIDWEFPGKHGKSDGLHVADLIASVRAALDAESNQSGKQLRLTLAVGPAPAHMDAIPWNRVEPMVDLVQIMAYNYAGPWDPVTGHLAPLMSPVSTSTSLSADASVAYLTGKHHVPSEKITLGIPFFGRSVKTVSTPVLRAPSTGKPAVELFPEGKGSPPYYAIQRMLPRFNEAYDPSTRSNYLVGRDGLQVFVSFDNESAVRNKAVYAVEKHLAGVMIWELSGDYTETFPGSGVVGATPLTDAIRAALDQARPMADRLQDTQAGF